MIQVVDHRLGVAKRGQRSLARERHRRAQSIHGAAEADAGGALALVHVASRSWNKVVGPVIPTTAFVDAAAVADQGGTSKVVHALVLHGVFVLALGGKIE